jgi:SSS family solute:Na+ symporter
MEGTAIGVLAYIGFSLIIGALAAGKVKTAEDFMIAGKSLPFSLATAAVFATWFGAETILGVAAEVSHKGLIGAIVDPLGAALCLFLVGVFIIKPLYKLNLLTLGDFFRVRFGSGVELVASVLMILSYLGWIAGQMAALGVLANLLLGANLTYATLIGSFLVIFYTFWGGMWSVATLDFFQNLIIVAGLIAVVYFVLFFQNFEFTSQALPENYFMLYPRGGNSVDWINYFAAWITIGLGSIPQQDVFQRVMAAKSEKAALISTLAGALLYLTVGLLPVLLAVCIRIAHPAMVLAWGQEPEKLQALIPQYIISQMPPALGWLFLGALFSAIFSTASGAILAAASVLSENIVKRVAPSLSPKSFLSVSRWSVVAVSILSLFLALIDRNIHSLVADSSAISLVSLFIPLVLGIFTRKQWNSKALIAAMLVGLGTWIAAKYAQLSIDPLIYGLAACILALGAGEITFRLLKGRS